MKKKVIIHPGLHKTGTSSIQSACAQHRGYLLERGILYPEFGAGRWANHSIPLSLLFMNNHGSGNHSVKHAFSTDELRALRATEIKAHLEHQLATASFETVVVSGEDISLFAPAELQQLAEFFKHRLDATFEIPVFTRNPVTYAISAAQELVRAAVMGIEQSLDLGNSQQAKSKIQNLLGSFKGHQLSVHNFDQAIQSDGGLIRYFFEQILSVKLPEVPTDTTNVSMPLEKALVMSACRDAGREMINKLNALLPENGNKITIDQQRFDKIWCDSDIDRVFLNERYGIHYDLPDHSAPSKCDLDLIFENIEIASSQLDLNCNHLLHKVVREGNAAFPHLTGHLRLLKGYIRGLQPRLNDQSTTANNGKSTLRDEIVGRLGGFDAAKLYGWARNKTTKIPVMLEIFVDGQKVGEVVANKFRKDLLATFGHACGFVFEFPREALPNSGQKISVRLQGTNVDLVNSPIEAE